ncbi:MAG: P-II family nitrogen regulator [Clostridia bacterium]|nr:P-II family nitrogen regulator [Clostridia bacterium]MBR2449348.1 P-II family nitrogen regulator [Clostridia bacterium]
MLGLKYLIAITKREYSEQYLDFFHRQGVKGVLSKLCNGTASDVTLDYLGIEKTEKIMFETIVKDEQIGELVKGLLLEMNINAVGNGIAMFIPIDGVGGMSSLKYFAGETSVEKKEESMEKESKSVLIITVVDKGNTDVVMDAARSAGARGGTVVKAKGTGAEIAKFFGVSISEEKEMVYIVATREGRDAIMRAIMEKAGSNTDAHGVIFSLPVDGVVGIKGFEEN